MSDERVAKNRMPWAFAIGVALLALGLFAVVASGGTFTAATLVFLAVGALLTCTGLVQRSIENLRR